MFSVSPKALFIGLIFGLLSLLSLYVISDVFEPLQPRRIVQQRQRQAPKRIPTPVAQVTQSAVTRPSISAQPEPAKPSATSDKAIQNPPTLLEICGSSWNVVAGTREADLQNDLRKKLLFLSQDCIERMRIQSQLVEIKNFVTNCQSQIEQKTPEFIETSCVASLPRFRAFIIRALGLDTSDLASLDTTDLANQLMGGMINIRNASETEIERNIALADALIAKDPNFYPAYKAKLVSRLVAELKYSKIQNPQEYESLYNELLSFSGDNPQDRLLSEATSVSGSSAATAETTGMDTDLVHIPFLRMAALNNVEGLASMAQDYVNAYPRSYIGYVYLADATWKSGDQATAVNILKTSLGPNATDAMAAEVLRRFQAQDPLERIMQMAPQN